MEEIHFIITSCFHNKFSKKILETYAVAMADIKSLSLLQLVYEQKPASPLGIKEYLEFIIPSRPLSTQVTDN